MFWNVHVDHSVTFADDPSNVILGDISLANVSNGEVKSVGNNAGHTYQPTVVRFKSAGHWVRIAHELWSGDGRLVSTSKSWQQRQANLRVVENDNERHALMVVSAAMMVSQSGRAHARDNLFKAYLART
jgi:hypothetical protein